MSWSGCDGAFVRETWIGIAGEQGICAEETGTWQGRSRKLPLGDKQQVRVIGQLNYQLFKNTSLPPAKIPHTPWEKSLSKTQLQKGLTTQQEYAGYLASASGTRKND